MNPLYVIVHEHLVYSDIRVHPVVESVRAEISRIEQEEDYVLVRGNPSIVPELPDNARPILVCGAYYSGKAGKEKCVDSQLEALLRAGYDAMLHPTGTLPFWLHEWKYLLESTHSF
jgi:hypothetical protein